MSEKTFGCAVLQISIVVTFVNKEDFVSTLPFSNEIEKAKYVL